MKEDERVKDAQKVYKTFTERHGFKLGGAWENLQPIVRNGLVEIVAIVRHEDVGDIPELLPVSLRAGRVDPPLVDPGLLKECMDEMYAEHLESMLGGMPDKTADMPSHYPAYIGGSPLIPSKEDCAACKKPTAFRYILLVGQSLTTHCPECTLQRTSREAPPLVATQSQHPVEILDRLRRKILDCHDNMSSALDLMIAVNDYANAKVKLDRDIALQRVGGDGQ